MKSLFSVEFWTNSDFSMHFAYYYSSFYYNGFNIERKNYNFKFIRNFYKL